MGERFERYNGGPVKEEDITIGNNFPEIWISDTDEVLCYLGICLSDAEQRTRSPFMQPYYMHGKHSTDKQIADKIKGFYRLADGCIVLDEYVDNGFYHDRTSKSISARVQFPVLDTYYGVMIDRKEDKDLTRAIFGLTYGELTSLLAAYAQVLGTDTGYVTYPKLTRSPRSSNYCDMTDVWIPEQFPYVAFAESGYDFSHVSLWGFYRHVQLLTGCEMNSAISQAFGNAGVSEEVFKRLFDVGNSLYSKKKVTRVP